MSDHGRANRRSTPRTEATRSRVASALAGRRWLDLVVLASVPLVLAVGFSLPAARKRELAFHYTDPSLLTAYTAHFVHLEAAHLLTNLVGYGLLAGVGYLVAVRARRRRFFLTAFVGVLAAFPVALSALNLAAPRNGILYGFSGLNMALLGLLGLLLVEFARVRLWGGFRRRDGGMLFFGSLATIAVLAVPPSATTGGIALAALAIGGVYVRDVVDRGFRLREFLRAVLEQTRDGNLLVAGGVLFAAYLFVGFPSNVVVDGAVLNLYVHFLGYSMGFVGSYVLLELAVFRTIGETPALEGRLEAASDAP